MFGIKRRLREAEAQIEAYKQLIKTQAERIDLLRTWQAEYTARLQRQAAITDATGTVMIALDRHRADDLSDNPTLAAAVLLLQANRSALADDALLALAKELHDPLAEAVDALFS